MMIVKTTDDVVEDLVDEGLIKSITYGALDDYKWGVKWVRVDDDFANDIKSMLLIISAFTKENTNGDTYLKELQAKYKFVRELKR